MGAGAFDSEDGVLTSEYGFALPPFLKGGRGDLLREPLRFAQPQTSAGFDTPFQGYSTQVAGFRRGVRHIWIHEGKGEVYLTAGYRTKEGDGEKLPEFYITDEVDVDILEALQLLAANLDSIHEKIKQPANAIIERLPSKTLAGDIAGDIWLMVESGLDSSEWSIRNDVREALLFLSYLWAFPNVDDLSICEKISLSSGSVVYIPPGTGHRGIDAFVNVITLPGFKPRNEIYLVLSEE